MRLVIQRATRSQPTADGRIIFPQTQTTETEENPATQEAWTHQGVRTPTQQNHAVAQQGAINVPSTQ